MSARRFALYPQETHWWSFADHENLTQAIERFTPQRVVEFGPGASTLALLEAGVQTIDTYEDDPKWLSLHKGRIPARFARVVTFHAYRRDSVPPPPEWPYDLAFVDGPHPTERRLPVIEWARDHSRVVLCHDADSLSRVFPELRFDMIGAERGLAEIGVLR